MMDSFPLGSGGGVLCRVQSASTDGAIKNMFDRAFAIVCRDASVPVGRLYALRNRDGDPLPRLAALRARVARCAGAEASATITGLAGVRVSDCTLADSDVGYKVYTLTTPKTSYVAEGLAGYDSALQLALRSVVGDRLVPGEISVATSGIGDPTAFARAQAGSLDADRALAEGYYRNNSGSYAEAAEFFATLLQREPEQGGSAQSRSQYSEYLINRALQQSNLGNFAEADALLAQADQITTTDPVQVRLRRNYRVLNLLNQQNGQAALAELDKPLPPYDVRAMPGADNAPVIDDLAAAQINTGAPLNIKLRGGDTANLTPVERAQILDAQALQLRGILLRLKGDAAGARTALDKTLVEIASVRDGRVVSTARLRAQTMAELALLAEERGDFAGAEGLLRDAVILLQTEYPASVAVAEAQARLAGYLARRGQAEPAIALFRQVVTSLTDAGGASGAHRNLLAPYFRLLTDNLAAQPALVGDLFAASETLLRPGVAQTQAILARELSGGSDDAARLFRQSVTLTRDVERSRIDIARLNSAANATPTDKARLGDMRAALAKLEADQTATQARLAAFPRYRVVAAKALTLAGLQQILKPGEAYLKLAIVGNDIYAVFASPDYATGYHIPITARALDAQVDALRATISVEEHGQLATYPFDIVRAHQLYQSLFAPVAERLAGLHHLIFEPDGAMLRLPPTVLVTDQASVDRYTARTASPSADAFDFTGTAWLGRMLDVSTAVSAQGFADVRAARPSEGSHPYIGFGHNQPVTFLTQAVFVRGTTVEPGDPADCAWPLSTWNRPISERELLTAQHAIGQGADVVTGAAFTDTALMARTDLAQYRILHFATHGLVTAPKARCPARPALLTSFGGKGSDGLLSFREIFDLHIDADLVILSACDTAGKASAAATREAGVTSGGDFALDGLVRGFVGAGGRSVVASHWPVPDQYDATERLISGLFAAQPGTPVATALRAAETALMNQPLTSHPYYWAGFAIIGDGAQPVIRAH